MDDFVIGPFWPNNVTAEEYADFLNHELFLLLEDLPLEVRRDMWFQQDGHPAHTSLAAREILNRDFPNRYLYFLFCSIFSRHDWTPKTSVVNRFKLNFRNFTGGLDCTPQLTGKGPIGPHDPRTLHALTSFFGVS